MPVEPEREPSPPPPDQPNWLHRNSLRLAIGASALSLTTTLATDPFGETIDRLQETAPYIGAGLVIGEGLWIAGAGMMLSAIGDKIWNPFQIHSKLAEITHRATRSVLFRAGLAINTIAAVGQTTTAAIGVVSEMPVKSWGLLTLAATDLVATIKIRRAIYHAINETVET